MFNDRVDAGKQLAKKLENYKENKDVLVLGIPRGGIVVANEIAKSLDAALDVITIKKIGAPENEELAIGAAGIDDYYLNNELIEELKVPQNYIEKEIRRKQSEAKEQYHELRGGMQPYKVKGKIIILVDDGIATGATMHLAVDLLRKGKPKKIVAAIPIAPPETVEKFKEIADEVICIEQPVFFMAVGQGYRNFTQTQDEEVQSILKNE